MCKYKQQLFFQRNISEPFQPCKVTWHVTIFSSLEYMQRAYGINTVISFLRSYNTKNMDELFLFL